MVRSPLRWLRRRLRGSVAPAPESTDPAADEGDDPCDDGPDGGDDGDGQVWDLIPSWQYDGIYVDKGGVSRREQEEALRDVQRRADAIDAREHDDADPGAGE